MKTMNMLIQERKEKLEILEQRKYKLIKEEKATRKVRIKNTKGNKKLNKAFLGTTAVVVAVSGIAVTSIELNAEEKVVAEKENKKEKKQEQTTTKFEKIERKQELFFAPMKESLIKKAIAPIKGVEIKETEGSVIFVSSKDKMVHSPLKGEIKKIENDNVSIQVESGEVVTIKNVTTDKIQIGEKMLQGEVLGVATADLEIEVGEKGQKFAKVATIFNQEATPVSKVETAKRKFSGISAALLLSI